MPLTTCPECGKDISDQADSCPHCGYALRRVHVQAWQSKWQRRATLWWLLMAGGAVPLFRGLLGGFEPIEITFGILLGLVGLVGVIVVGIAVSVKRP